MKKEKSMRAFGALATLALVLSGCVKEKTLSLSEPGTPIRFDVSTGWENQETTRTEYSGRDENNALVSAGSRYERIDWVGGKDMIRVVCETASGGTVLNGIGDDYVLGTPSADGRKSTAEIAPKSGDGLRWGAGDHYFYAFYPAPGTESNYAFRRNNPVLKENVYMAAASNTAKVSGVIPAVQEAILESGTSTYKPNMNYGYMYAATKVGAGDASGSISLSFLPLVTTLEFTLKNFAASPVTEKLTRVELRSKSTPLTGTFTALLSTGADPVITTEGTGNSVTINLPNGGITLSETTPVRFTFLTLPVEQTELTLVLSFGADYSKKRTLALKDTELVTAENPEGWITAGERKKVYISNVAVPGGDLWTYTLDVTGNYTTSVPMAGGNVNYTVQSYRTSVTNPSVRQPVTWTTQYSVDGGAWTTTCPDWLQSFNTTGPGSIASPWEPDEATLPANDTPMVWEGSTTPVATTQATARDLSCYDIYGNFTGGVEGTTPYNTANCYVVGAPGWYRIPCVYGNAIKNGEDNPSSYTGPASGANLMTGGFLNHADAHITSPWIKDQGNGSYAASMGNADLIWQDHQGLITQVAYESDYIYFYVNPNNIFQGNALIALKSINTGSILWSWHIWVVDNPETRLVVKTLYSHPTVNHSVQDPTLILPMDLGFCDTAPGAVRSRNVRVKFIQENTGLEKVVTINQIGAVSYNVTYYQWGRKDPMPPGIINLSTTSSGTALKKTLYQINGATYSCPSPFAGKQSIGNAIRNPSTFIKRNEDNRRNWTDRYDNLWNTNVLQAATTTKPIDLVVCKTIYDPCPPGYKLPNKNVFSGFTLSGDNYPFYTGIGTGTEVFLPLTPDDPVSIEDLSTYNTLLGYYFYLDQQDHSKGTIFMGRTGSCYDLSGNIIGLGDYSDHLTATPAQGYGNPDALNTLTMEGMSYLTFSSVKVHPFWQQSRSFGMPIRPIAEN